MNAQELIQKNALVEKVIKEQGLQEKAGPFISENAVIKTEELEKTIKGMQAENRGLKVGIIGRVKAGKSSLLNALIFEGKDVLPKAATPMTASLTILKYAQNLSAEAQFYDEKDIEELKRDHERYEKKFKEIVSEEKKKLEEKQQGFLNEAKGVMGGIGKAFGKDHEEAPKQKILSPEEIRKRAERKAKSELDDDAKLSASHDQYERMKKSGLIDPKDLETRIQADSLEELNQKLYQFVGKEGKFMPYTKAVQTSLNNPNLKDLEIIDTPGVNDPVVSREERTKALLKECDVVFVISPSNQFLTDSDMDLFDRVSNKEGIQEIYFVASQIDSRVCSSSVIKESHQHLPTALENEQKKLLSQLKVMEYWIQKWTNQRKIFEKVIKNGVIFTSGACFSMYQDFENRASWEREKEDYQLAWKNLTDAYPKAFDSDDKSKENLLLLSNMSAIKERLEEVAKEKENIISQRLQNYAKSQANNLHKLITDLLQDLEKEKNRIKNADMVAIKKQIEAYEKLSDKIEIGFRDAYEEFISGFIQNIRDGLNEALKEAIKNAVRKIRQEKEIEIEKDHCPTKVPQKGFLGPIKRTFGNFFGKKSWGYDEVWRTEITEVTTVKAGVVVDLLIKMHEICENALNDSVKSFKSVFKKELYAKVFPILRKIINDDSLIDEVAFYKSVMAVLDSIKFKEFDHTDIPSEIKNQTGLLKDYRADRFEKRVEEHLKGFEAKVEKDMKGYIKVLNENLKDQNFATDVLSKLKNDMQNLRNQIQNKEQSIAQIEGQIKALKEIQ
ncbi:dynamin family protein [Helicobacter pylori]|uniref:dynamin family protein n=1 Tax=Helicobacter pylori TaxID=210 RepID=UPI00165AECB4|nr:dynamin family protein [Helicobacter pylori]WQS20315.1 dynamin family protein [Helicobacter pylori]WQS29650.1 dynamin family protein [Helicobacter pylori]